MKNKLFANMITMQSSDPAQLTAPIRFNEDAEDPDSD
jgi:hypothetical protein